MKVAYFNICSPEVLKARINHMKNRGLDVRFAPQLKDWNHPLMKSYLESADIQARLIIAEGKAASGIMNLGSEMPLPFIAINPDISALNDNLTQCRGKIVLNSMTSSYLEAKLEEKIQYNLLYNQCLVYHYDFDLPMSEDFFGKVLSELL